MAKTQTYIALIETAAGKMLTFDRWSYKRPETIVKKYAEAVEADLDFWCMIWKGGANLALYATPDGCNTEEHLALTVPLSELPVKSERIKAALKSRFCA